MGISSSEAHRPISCTTLVGLPPPETAVFFGQLDHLPGYLDFAQRICNLADLSPDLWPLLSAPA
jgi:hypothetical protein